MKSKIRRPKVNIPSYVKVMSMLSPSKKGTIDRSFIKAMTVAIGDYQKHKTANMKKLNNELSED